MRAEENCLDLWGPFTIVGDIHGQFYDLVKLLEREWKVESHPRTWLFLGDYVDRGPWGLEVCITLFMYKICFPRNVYLLRGNHESRVLTQKFNFKDECLRGYDLEIYDLFMESFDCLPLAALLSTDAGVTFFAVHGGLSPEIDCWEKIQEIDRFQEIPPSGAMCDLIWSDPLEECTGQGLPDSGMKEWFDVEFVHNPTRGVGQVYGFRALTYFLADNGLTGIIRAHESCREGYTENWMCRKGKEERNHPYVTTVFSAPNYCGWYGNQAAIMNLESDATYSYKIFDEVENKPYVLPKQMNGISYSLPWVTQNLLDLVGKCFNLVLDEIGEQHLDELRSSRTYVRNKILSLTKARDNLLDLRNSDERIIKLQGLYGSDLPPQVRSLSDSELSSLIQEYNKIKEIDCWSELCPGSQPKNGINPSKP
eukprot:TRINITY_DN5906_c0_g1_i5.p1 TRINITY_DN5906_c0_g1~~TRINITY_DN5906_c0_g1_i5.p1  ORF type:complete len:491 (-),score=90.58 TRINITY_DN5906_c0_g1_i5:79-1347(-)